VCVISASCSRPETHTVTIENQKYSPVSVTAAPGDTVLFINKDLVPHTVSALGVKGFDSGLIAAGGEWKLEAKSPGTFAYHCLLHPEMQGSVVVK
jgi:plastocyanin